MDTQVSLYTVLTLAIFIFIAIALLAQHFIFKYNARLRHYEVENKLLSNLLKQSEAVHYDAIDSMKDYCELRLSAAKVVRVELVGWKRSVDDDNHYYANMRMSKNGYEAVGDQYFKIRKEDLVFLSFNYHSPDPNNSDMVMTGNRSLTFGG